MKLQVPWPGNLCILCLLERELTIEHLIPEALGGRLTARFLCKACNSTLGAKVEASARTDPSIRLAVSNLSTKIPELAQKLAENQSFLGESKAGHVRGYVSGGEFRVHSTQEKDGSLIQPTDKARQTIESILRKSGYNATPLEEALLAFDHAPEDERVQVAPGLVVVKGRKGVGNLLLAIKTICERLASPSDPCVFSPWRFDWWWIARSAGASFVDDFY